MLSRLWAAIGRLAESLFGFADALDGVSHTIRRANILACDRLDIQAADHEPKYLPEPSTNGVAHPEPTPTTVGLPQPSTNKRRKSIVS